MSGIRSTEDGSSQVTVTVHHLCAVVGVPETELRIWMANDWVRPRQDWGEPRFSEADVARIRLILDLRDAMALDAEAIPVVLGLVDQLYDERNRVRALCDAIRSAGLMEAVWRHLEPG